MKFIAVHILANRYCNIFDSEGQDTDTMAVHKKISANSSAVKTWTFYLEHLGQYCLTNNINIVKKEESILLTLCGPFTHQYLKMLVQPDSLTTRSYDELIEMFRIH